MLYNKRIIQKKSINWHKTLAWWGAIALIIFAISGMMHPIMRWTGPQTTAFFPPQSPMKATHAEAIAPILQQHGISKAKVVKVIPSKVGPVLQITESEHRPRRYFDLNSKQELIGYDAQHAVWLARYYTGETAAVESIVFQDEFDRAYPWVNRLLPVYRVRFASDDQLTAFIYTETNALANLTNDWKTSMQTVFRALHTWNWLDEVEHARVLLMTLLLLCLTGLVIAGTAMVFSIKHRQIKNNDRRWHRRIAYITWLPVLLLSISGIYHLLQFAYGDNLRGLRLSDAININPSQLSDSGDWLTPYADTPLNAISLVPSPNEGLMFRLGIPQGKQKQNVTHHARFDGVSSEKSAHYFDAKNGEALNIDDRELAIFMAEQHLGLSHKQVIHTERVTRFGVHYDFRNKRLPAWRIDYDTEQGDIVFIDPTTGVLADRLVNAQRYEMYSFSFLHKWNPLQWIIGRDARDIVVVCIIMLTLMAMLLGIRMKLRKTKVTAASDDSAQPILKESAS